MTSRAEGASPFREQNALLRDFIHEQMRLHGWHYAEFARAAGTDVTVVSRWLKGKARPSPRVTRQMAGRLDVDAEELMHIVGHVDPEASEETLEQASDETPEQSALIAKIRQITLNQDRYRILDAQLEAMRQHEP